LARLEEKSFSFFELDITGLSLGWAEALPGVSFPVTLWLACFGSTHAALLYRSLNINGQRFTPSNSQPFSIVLGV
jgi:hypothetical protein